MTKAFGLGYNHKHMNLFCGYTAEKKPFSLKTRQSHGWNEADQLVSLNAARRLLQPHDYLGIFLSETFPLLVIDIDDSVPSNDYARILAACESLFGKENFYIERSLSKQGLHILVKTETFLPEWNRKKGQIFGYNAETYTAHQGILLTEDYELFPNTLDLETFWLFAMPVRLDHLHDWFIITAPTANQPMRKPYASNLHPLQSVHQKPKKYTIFLELIHLFPSFYMPYLQPFIHHQANEDEIRLTRSGKDKSEGYSATFFTKTGIIYNFSTNWEGLPLRVGITLHTFIIITHNISAETLAKRFYQFLKTSCQKLRIPIPKRKRKNYFCIKRKYLYMLLILEYLLQHPNHSVTITEIQNHLESVLFFKIHRTTILRYLQILQSLKLIRKSKLNRKNHYALNLNNQPLSLRELTLLERGYQLIVLQLLLNLREAAALAILFTPPNVTLSAILHTSRGMPIYIQTPCRIDALARAFIGRCFFSLYADPPSQ